MKNRIKKTTALFLLLLAVTAKGQNNDNIVLPDLIPPSPQAAQFIRYGEIPVGHTTGVPQIDIPIYTLSTGWIDIPVSISYHASGFRVRDIPSPVGLGWVLNAGGLISRAIEMKADFENTDTMVVKSVADVEAVKKGELKVDNLDLGQYDNCDKWKDYVFDTQNRAAIDTRSDRYTYNFFGNNGVARYDVDADKLLPVPYAPLDITRVSKDCYVITDTKGIKYEFTCPDYTVSTANWQNVPTGWYITKITYPGKENDPVVFSYKRVGDYSEIIYSQTTTIPRSAYSYDDMPSFPPRCLNDCPSPGQADTRMSPVTLYYNSPLITSIQWRNVTIAFNYAADRKDQRKERLTSVVVKQGNDVIRQALLDNNCYFGNTERNYRLKLNNISIYGNTTNGAAERYSFNYKENITPPDYYRYWASAKPCNEDLWGYYNGANSNYALPSEIGQYLYNTTKSYPHSSYSANESANRTPDEDYTKTCILEEIVYPTKGKTRFEYEINRIPGFYVNIGNSVNDKVGGLRLKKRTNYSDTGAVTDVKEYQYEGYGTMSLKYEMFIGERRVTQQFGSHGPLLFDVPWAVIIYTVGLSSPLLSLTGWSNSPVFYDKVTEYNGETINHNYSGKTEYYYYADNASSNYPSVCHYDGTGYTPMNFSVYNDCDKGFIAELPSSTKIFDENDVPVKTIENNYNLYPVPYIHTGVHLAQSREFPDGFHWYIDFEKYVQIMSGNPGWNPQNYYERNFLDNIVAVNTYAVQEISLLQSTVETDYVNGRAATVKTTSYNYDTKDGKPLLFTPSSVTLQNSDGEIRVKKTVFPYNDAYKNTAPYNTMVGKNMLDYPLEVKNEKGSDNQFISQTLTSYKQSADLILPDVLSTRYRADGSAEQRIVYRNYDSYGNPVYITKDNAESVVYLWSYNGQYPIAEIRNATFAEAEAAAKAVFPVSGINALSALATPDEAKLKDGSLQKALPDARVTTYTYRPLIGTASVTTPEGVVTDYYYDTFGRLYLIRDDNQNIIGQYGYGYKDASDNGTGGYGGISGRIDLDISEAGCYTVGASGRASLSNVSGGSGNYSYSWYLTDSRYAVLSGMPGTTSTSYPFTCPQAGSLHVYCEIADHVTGIISAVHYPYPITVISADTGHLTMTGDYISADQVISVSGNTVKVHLLFAPQMDLVTATWYQLGTLSENCRPSAKRTVKVETTDYTVNYTINPDGTVILEVIYYRVQPGFFPRYDQEIFEFSYDK